MFSTLSQTEIINSANSNLSSANALHLVKAKTLSFSKELTFTRQKILDSSKLKEFADDNFKFDKNGRKLSKRVENTVGKGEIALYEQFFLFPQCFQKACFPGGVKRCHCVGMG